MTDVTIFAPSPTLTVTVEDHPSGSDIHVHAGGQGVWQARMLRRLGCTVTMCCVLTGEIGEVLRALLPGEGIELAAVDRQGRGSAYIHDRRGGKREALVEEDGDPLGRHELDDLYGTMVHAAMDSSAVILSGPFGDGTLPADMYRRLAADLAGGNAPVIADLAGERLGSVLQGGIDVLKVSDEELRADGLIDDDSPDAVMRAMTRLQERGARGVIVTRAAEPLLLLDADGFVEVSLPRFEENETRGAGDSLTAGVAAALSRGASLREAITLGAAAGALNVTRHGLGTGDGEAIDRLRAHVQMRERMPASRASGDGSDGSISPDDLADMASDREQP